MKKMKRKIVSIVLAVTMAVTMLFSFGASATETVASLSIEQENLLRYLDIVTVEEIDYNKELTRGELAELAARVGKIPEYTGGETFFYDVPNTHKYYKDIYALAGANILSGDGNGFYRPDEGVLPLELCKVFSVILGYEVIGHYDDFRKVANRIGISDGIEFGETVTYGQALQMAWDTLESEMLEPVIYGDQIEYRVTKDYLAIERYHGLVKQRGLVKGVPGSTLIQPDDSINSGEILIEDKIFYYNDPSLLGKQVVFYSERDHGVRTTKKEIQYLYVDEERNNIVTIVDKDAKGKNGNEYIYYQGNKERKLRVSDTVDVIYNGVAYPRYQDNELVPASGTVTLIDNNNDKIYDVISVVAYEYMMIENVDKEHGIIYGKYPEKSKIGSTTQNTKFTVLMEVGEGELHFLLPGDMIAAKVSKNQTGTKLAHITLLDAGTTGVVEGLHGDEVTVGGISYTMNDATVVDEEIRPLETVTVYQYDGHCAAIIHAKNDAYQFGYLLDATIYGSAFTGSLSVRLVNAQRNIMELDAGKSIMIDEMKFTDAEAARKRLALAKERRILSPDLSDEQKQMMNEGDTKWPYSQPVRFRLNNEGVLTHLDTLLYEEGLETEASLRPYSSDGGTVNAEAVSSMWGSRSKNFFIGEKLFFSLPDMSNVLIPPINARDEVAYYKTSVGDASTNVVEGYTVDPESRIARYAIVYSMVATSVNEEPYPVIVAEKSTALGENGEIVRQVTLFGSAGETSTYTLRDEVADEELNLGDVIRFQTDMEGKISLVTPLCPVHEGDGMERVQYHGTKYGNTYGYRHRAAYGTITLCQDDIIAHTTSVSSDTGGGVYNLENYYNYLPSASTTYYIADKNDGTFKIRKGSAMDIIPYFADKTTTQRAVMITYAGRLDIVYILDFGEGGSL